MTSISNNIQSRPSYKSTKTCAGVGLGVGTMGATGLVVTGMAPRLMKGAEIGVKKAFIQAAQEGLTSAGIDLSKTTVTRALKSAVKKKALKTLALWTAVGTGVGLAIDLYKNHKAKKAENV